MISYRYTVQVYTTIAGRLRRVRSELRVSDCDTRQIGGDKRGRRPDGTCERTSGIRIQFHTRAPANTIVNTRRRSKFVRYRLHGQGWSLALLVSKNFKHRLVANVVDVLTTQTRECVRMKPASDI